MSVICLTKEESRNKLKFITDGRRDGETFFYQYIATRDLCWGTNADMKCQMKLWKKHALEGKIKFTSVLKPYEINGKNYHIMLVHDMNDERDQIDELTFGLDLMFTGVSYWFISESNRDAVFKYVCPPDNRGCNYFCPK